MKPDDDIAPHWNEAELSILSSAEADRPPVGAVERTLAGLGVGAGVVAVASLGKAAAVGNLARGSLWLKWVGVALAGAGLAGSVLVVKQYERDKAAALPSARAAHAPSPVLEPGEPVAPPNVVPEVAEMQAANQPPAASTRAPAPSRGASSEKARPNDDALNAEIRTIDEARQRLRRGDAHGALAVLDRYTQMIGRGGSLRAEASVVRIEALQASGDARGATALGQRFLAKNPQSPYADYVRRILAHSK